MQVAKWGNSLAIRIPAAIVEILQLKEGDEVEIRVADSRQLEVSHKPSRAELLKRLRQYEGRGDAMRYLDADGIIAWKASPLFLAKLADVERDVEEELADFP